MVPFKPIFMGLAPAPENPRATTSQKCVRTNDIENVGVTKRHHTFFEMLGNFSFGDYFKRDAIQWAWQLLTEVYEIPAARLAVSVYESDDEAYQVWRDVIGVPESQIQRLGDEDNFWASGPTGPCGPCSEIYFDFNPADVESRIDLEDDERFIELYNLVFMQFSRDADGQLTPLASKNIDTGMGLERMAQVLQRVPNNYETDLILPIMNAVAQQAGFADFYSVQPLSLHRSLKVVGDHVRSVAHLVSDGVRPSNVGRGYIVRRLIRRIVRHGRLLGIDGPFTRDILPVVARLAADAGLNHIQEQQERLANELEREEVRFLQTLVTGEERLQELLDDLVKRAPSGDGEDGARIISGEDAFELYDTFGFPLELTSEIAHENNVEVDLEAFEICMQQQRERARAARESFSLDPNTNPEINLSVASAALAEAVAAEGKQTLFEGYQQTSVDRATITGLLVSGMRTEVAHEGDSVRLLLDVSPFYAEGGGQVGDTGLLTGPTGTIRVDDTKRDGDGEHMAHMHIGTVLSGEVAVGDIVQASIDASARRRIAAHHTATHLLQAALKQVLPDMDICQAGSLVDAERLRFDFNCNRALTDDEVASVEQRINAWIADGTATVVSTMPLAAAKDAGAVAMFGEKYDAGSVRVVDVPGISMELCGGTHVTNIADISLFKITSESGPSAGVRRIEAVCGAAALPYLAIRDQAVRQLGNTLKASPDQLVPRVTALQQELRSVSKKLETAHTALAVAHATQLANEKMTKVGDFSFIVAELCITDPSSSSGGAGNDDASQQQATVTVSPDSLKVATMRVGQKAGDSTAVLFAARNEEAGKIAFAAAVGKNVQKQGVQAGKLVGAIAKICGGGGGGRPNFAQAGGRDISKLDTALHEASQLLRSGLEEAK